MTADPIERTRPAGEVDPQAARAAQEDRCCRHRLASFAAAPAVRLALASMASELVFWLVLFAWGGLGASLGPAMIFSLFLSPSGIESVTMTRSIGMSSFFAAAVMMRIFAWCGTKQSRS